jgi:hypothetical protein
MKIAIYKKKYNLQVKYQNNQIIQINLFKSKYKNQINQVNPFKIALQMIYL